MISKDGHIGLPPRLYTKVVTCCRKCPNYVDTPRETFCNLHNKDLYRRNDLWIPKWCTLPDADEDYSDT